MSRILSTFYISVSLCCWRVNTYLHIACLVPFNRSRRCSSTACSVVMMELGQMRGSTGRLEDDWKDARAAYREVKFGRSDGEIELGPRSLITAVWEHWLVYNLFLNGMIQTCRVQVLELLRPFNVLLLYCGWCGQTCIQDSYSSHA